MGELVGERIIVEDCILGKAVEGILANNTLELDELDPNVGIVLNPTVFSIRVSDGPEIGVCSMYNFDGMQAELGIRIWDKEYWNGGYGTEAITLLSNWAFAVIKVQYLYLKTPINNERALHCYAKCGFVECHNTIIDGYAMVWMRKHRSEV